MVKLNINPKYRDLIPPISKEEYDLLEKSILQEGCRDALVIWDDCILDGHNRYEICQKHDLRFKVIDKSFENEEEAKVWIIRNQLARRNLPPHERTRLALMLKPTIEEKAEERMKTGKADPGKKSAQGKTREEIAKLAGVSHDTVRKVETIEKNATEEVKQAARKGEMSVNRAYKEVKGYQKTGTQNQLSERKKNYRFVNSLRFEELNKKWKEATKDERRQFLRLSISMVKDKLNRYRYTNKSQFLESEKEYYAADIDQRTIDIILKFGVYYNEAPRFRHRR